MFDPLNMGADLGTGGYVPQQQGGYYSPSNSQQQLGGYPAPQHMAAASMPVYSAYASPPPPPPPPALPMQQQQRQQPRAQSVYSQQEMTSMQDPLSLSLLSGPAATAAASPAATSSGGSPAAHGTKKDDRMIYDLHKLDPDYFRRYEGFHEVVSEKQALLQVVISALMLFNTVTTTMTVVSNFRTRVNPYNNPSFDILVSIMTFFPLIYMILLMAVFNNYYSQKVFYFLIERGAILNFNNSYTAFGYLVSNALPALFFFSFVGYVVLSVVVFITFGGTVGDVLIFVNNAALGFGLYWYRQQSVEDKLVTLPSFVEHFSNFDGEASDIDLTSFNRASEFMKKAPLVQATDPTYSSSFRKWYFDANDYSSLNQIGLIVLQWSLVLISIGLAFGYFFYMDEMEVKARWNTVISPCISSCASGVANTTNALGNVSALPLVSAGQCSFCVCSCYKTLNRRDKKTTTGCKDYFAPGTLARRTVCPAANLVCPDTCTWFPGWNDDN